uniref:Uncharacterized protein n=1 Tax=Haemonchus contortus TaxID=6289 RepID=A0A7I4Y2A6_HAECO
MQVLYVFFVLLCVTSVIFASNSLPMSPRFKRQFGGMGGGSQMGMGGSQMGGSQMGGSQMGGWGR